MSTLNRIDLATPVRVAQTPNTGRTAPDTGFGAKVKTGLDTVAGAVSNGAAMVAPLVPGGHIISAAVSNLSGMTSGPAGAVGAQYASGVASLGTGTQLGGTTGGMTGGTGSTGMANVGGGASSAAQFGSAVQGEANNLNQLIQMQMHFQKENQSYSAISNVLKVRHETNKNSIQNIR